VGKFDHCLELKNWEKEVVPRSNMLFKIHQGRMFLLERIRGC
jgi:hypothetical protein